MKVRAKKIGWTGKRLVNPGEEIDIDDALFSEKWMEKVSPDEEKTAAPGEPSEEDLIADGQIPESVPEEVKEPETLSEAAQQRRKGGRKGDRK